MRRLTFILSDLYLPAESESDLPVTRPLEHLEWLLRICGRAQVSSWRPALCASVGRPDLARVAPATLAARGTSLAPAEHCWLASPVNFEARLDHVRLSSAGLLSLTTDERAALREEFTRVFGPELALHDAGPRGFLLSGLPPLEAHSVDPAQYLGADISSGLPRGPGAATLRRLGAELEMWLHGSTLNRERTRHRRAAVSALWLWGGQGSDATESATGVAPPSVVMAGVDSVLAGLSREVSGAEPMPVPESLRDFAVPPDYRVVELTPLTDARHSFEILEAHWFGPARDALKGGELDLVEIFANHKVFRVTSRDRFAFWRRHRPWLETLGHAARAAKA